MASVEESIAPEEVEPIVAKSPRLTSLDAFRGATVALMLLVNNLALDQATPAQLVHAPFGEWARLADLVFPWFLLCAGLSLPLSYRSARRRGVDYRTWARKAVGRAVGLLVLGMLLDSAINRRPTYGSAFSNSLASASLVAALIMPLRAVVRGAAAAGLLASYGAALAWIPVPSEGRSVLTEHANLVFYLNDAIFRPMGLRGLPSVVPTAALVVMGSLVGGALVRPHRRFGVVASGLVLAGLGAGWFLLGHPMSKEIWTAPYILFAGGLGTAIVGLLALSCSMVALGPSSPRRSTSSARTPSSPTSDRSSSKSSSFRSGPLSTARRFSRLGLPPPRPASAPLRADGAYTLGYMALTWAVLAWMRARNLTLRL